MEELKDKFVKLPAEEYYRLLLFYETTNNLLYGRIRKDENDVLEEVKKSIIQIW